MTGNSNTETIYRELKKHALSKEKGMSSIRLTEIADVIMTLRPHERQRLVPAFNDCAKRVAWGKLPQAHGIIDVFAPYRSIITWVAASVPA